MLILHVDDLLIGANMNDKETTGVIEKLKKSFDFGKWQELSEETAIVYCGGTISIKNKVMQLDFESYLKKMMPITIQKGRGKDDFLNASEVSKARGLIGALQWPAGQGCPHICASCIHVNWCSQHQQGNHRADPRSQQDLEIWQVGSRSTSSISSCDRLLGRPAATGIFRCCSTSSSRQEFQGEVVPYTVLSWRSFKLTRVCRSSLSAESQAFSTALDELLMLKTMIAMLKNPALDPKDHATAASVTSAAVIGAKGLYDALKKEGVGSAQDKRAGIEIMCAKEELARQNTVLRWVSSERMLADGLTKTSSRQDTVDMMRSGRLCQVQSIQEEGQEVQRTVQS